MSASWPPCLNAAFTRSPRRGHHVSRGTHSSLRRDGSTRTMTSVLASQPSRSMTVTTVLTAGSMTGCRPRPASPASCSRTARPARWATRSRPCWRRMPRARARRRALRRRRAAACRRASRWCTAAAAAAGRRAQPRRRRHHRAARGASWRPTASRCRAGPPGRLREHEAGADAVADVLEPPAGTRRARGLAAAAPPARGAHARGAAAAAGPVLSPRAARRGGAVRRAPAPGRGQRAERAAARARGARRVPDRRPHVARLSAHRARRAGRCPRARRATGRRRARARRRRTGHGSCARRCTSSRDAPRLERDPRVLALAAASLGAYAAACAHARQPRPGGSGSRRKPGLVGEVGVADGLVGGAGIEPLVARAPRGAPLGGQHRAVVEDQVGRERSGPARAPAAAPCGRAAAQSSKTWSGSARNSRATDLRPQMPSTRMRSSASHRSRRRTANALQPEQAAAADDALGAIAELLLDALVGVDAQQPVRAVAHARCDEQAMVARLVPGTALDVQDLEDLGPRREPRARAVERAVVEGDDAVDVRREVRDQARQLVQLVADREQGEQANAPRRAPRRRAGRDRRASNLSSHFRVQNYQPRGAPRLAVVVLSHGDEPLILEALGLARRAVRAAGGRGLALRTGRYPAARRRCSSGRARRRVDRAPPARRGAQRGRRRDQRAVRRLPRSRLRGAAGLGRGAAGAPRGRRRGRRVRDGRAGRARGGARLAPPAALVAHAASAARGRRSASASPTRARCSSSSAGSARTSR